MEQRYELSHNSGMFVRLPNGMQISDLDKLDSKLTQHVLITGLGRSGTTATAKIFAAFGFHFFGEQGLMESEAMRKLLLEDNFVELNRQIKTWNNVGRCGWKEPKLRSYRAREFIYRLPKNIALVIVFRDLASSACRRTLEDGGDYLNNLELTQHSYTKLLQTIKFQKNRLCIFVSYEKILVNTSAIVRDFARFFKIDDEEKIKTAISSISVSPKEYLIASTVQKEK